MKTQLAPMHNKITVRVNDKQYQAVVKAAKKHKMNVAEYIRACIL